MKKMIFALIFTLTLGLGTAATCRYSHAKTEVCGRNGCHHCCTGKLCGCPTCN